MVEKIIKIIGSFPILPVQGLGVCDLCVQKNQQSLKNHNYSIWSDLVTYGVESKNVRDGFLEPCVEEGR